MKSTEKVNAWKFLTLEPNKKQIKAMFAKAISVAVEVSMNNHLYKFNNETRLQTEGGSIGVDLTGELAEMQMLIWGNTLKQRLESMSVKNDFQQRLVDDITLVPTVIPKGWKVLDDRLVFSRDQEEVDEDIPDDVRTMKIIQQIANEIDDQFKVTFDVPTNHEDGRVPILDIKVSVNSDNLIDYIFYQKPMASKKVILKSSAMSYRNKIITLTQECFRRLHNTSESIEESVKIVILNKFMKSLKLSGYGESERLLILESGLNTFEKLKKREVEGERPFQRSWEF